ncbi:MtnX-like HAD-IB family phosphatase [Anoxybacillus sp. D401a]|uniref:MtnX-like HAD-IB family phosphatase n=1 Tax=Anoxybacillus sp. D401a TaxID=575112 RepID=UPI003D351294
MNKWAFVSDFDGTISHKDFYWIVIEKYFPEGEQLFHQWRAGKIKDIDFLSTVFTSIHQDEEKIIEDIHHIPIDETVLPFIKHVQRSGGDFYVLSAGTDYYIRHILKKYDINGVDVFSNEGYYHDKNIHMRIDPNHIHYSERYGIDKSSVVRTLKQTYETVYFIGDSEPDVHAAKVADVTFAKGALQSLLRKQHIPFVPVDTFADVERYLQEKGVLK